MTPTRKPPGCTFWPTRNGPPSAHRDGDVATALADAVHAAHGPELPPLKGGTLVDASLFDVQIVGRERVVVLGVGDGRVQDPGHHARGVAVGEEQRAPRLGHGLAADKVDDLSRLAWRCLLYTSDAAD